MNHDPSLLTSPGPSLGRLFLDTARRAPDRIALSVGGRSLSYATLAAEAGKLAAVLARVERPAPRLGAIFAVRSAVAYQGVLGTLISGAGYVPLNLRYPDARSGHMLEVSGSSTLVVDAEGASRLDGLLAHVTRPLCIVLATHPDVAPLAARHPRHRFVGAAELAATEPLLAAPEVDPAAIAYLMFTSGSTGRPKGVMVSHANALAMVDTLIDRYQISERDRFSQGFDMTFDLSVFDMFVCWAAGASLYCVPESARGVPVDFIRSNELTCWFSVPSLAMSLRQLKRLAPDAFPTLRLSLFCGERLPVEAAVAWQRAAPASIVENLYGPTEVTVACTHYRWDPASSPAAAVDGVVPIGQPFRGMAAAVVGPDLQLTPRGVRGELCMRGPQVTPGYWRDPDQTAARYVAMPWCSGPDNRWYRTGDIALVDERGDLIHCGRNDAQVKLRGYRIELMEIEHALREASGSDFVAVLPFPADDSGPSGLTAIVSGTEAGEERLRELLAEKLPVYMLPDDILWTAEMPLNVNGKIDRNRLLQMLAEQDARLVWR